MKTGTWIAGLMLMGLTLFTSSARADHFRALQQDGVALDGLVHALCDEVRGSLRAAPNFPVIVAKVQVLESRVHLLQTILARPASQNQLYNQLEAVDRLACSVEDSVFDAARGRPGFHGGFVDTRRADQLLRSIDNTIHHMEVHVDALRDCDLQPVVVQRPIVANPGWNAGFNGNQGWNNNNWNSAPSNGWNNHNNNWNQGPNNGWNGIPNSNWNGNTGIVPPGIPNSQIPRPGISVGNGGVSFNGRGVSFTFGR